MTILCLIFYFDAFLVLGPSFFFMDPTFICDGSDEVVDESIACPKLAECHIGNYSLIKSMISLLLNDWVCTATAKANEMLSRQCYQLDLY